MKKNLLIAIVLIASISFGNLNAQVNGGFKMGVDLSNLRIYDDNNNANDDLDTKRLITPRLGFFLEVAVNDFLFAQVGLYGAAKGFRYKSTRTINGVVYDSKEYEIVASIDMPINFGYRHELGDINLFIMAGPTLSYNTYATLLYKADDEWDNDHQTVGTDVTDFIKPFNFGANVEVGLEVNRFQFSTLYSYGFSNLANLDGLTIRSNAISFMVAIKFGRVD
ncbi:MAG: outer membrane beta-barrel protein [Bacteroidota bacterium]